MKTLMQKIDSEITGIRQDDFNAKIQITLNDEAFYKLRGEIVSLMSVKHLHESSYRGCSVRRIDDWAGEDFYMVERV